MILVVSRKNHTSKTSFIESWYGLNDQKKSVKLFHLSKWEDDRITLTCPFFLDVHDLFHLIFNHFLVCPSSDGTCHGSSLWKGILEFLFI